MSRPLDPARQRFIAPLENRRSAGHCGRSREGVRCPAVPCNAASSAAPRSSSSPQCPRCLYLDVARGIPRPSGPPFTLNNAVDAADEIGIRPLPGGRRAAPAVRLGRHRCRAVPARRTRPLAAQFHRRALAGRGDRLDALRRGRRPVAGALRRADRRRLQGDLAHGDADRAQPVSRRTGGRWTSTSSSSGARVSRSATAAGSSTRTATAGPRTFGDKLCFTTALVPYDGDDAWVLDVFRRAVAIVSQAEVPPPAPDCEYCAYVASAAQPGQVSATPA